MWGVSFVASEAVAVKDPDEFGECRSAGGRRRRGWTAAIARRAETVAGVRAGIGRRGQGGDSRLCPLPQRSGARPPKKRNRSRVRPTAALARSNSSPECRERWRNQRGAHAGGAESL